MFYTKLSSVGWAPFKKRISSFFSNEPDSNLPYVFNVCLTVYNLEEVSELKSINLRDSYILAYRIFIQNDTFKCLRMFQHRIAHPL